MVDNRPSGRDGLPLIRNTLAKVDELIGYAQHRGDNRRIEELQPIADHLRRELWRRQLNDGAD